MSSLGPASWFAAFLLSGAWATGQDQPKPAVTPTSSSVETKPAESQPGTEPAESKPIKKKLDLETELNNEAKKALTDPALIDRAFENWGEGNLARLIQDLHIQFKTFEGNDGADAALGFEYNMTKALVVDRQSSSWSLDFVANGNVAFDQDVNPDDFLSTSFRMRWFGSHAYGGTEGSSKPPASTTSADRRLADAGADYSQFKKEFKKQFEKLADELVDIDDAADVRKNPEFIALKDSYLQNIKYKLPPELIYDFDLHAGLESNQDFSSKQEVFGVSLGGRLVSWNPDSSLSQLNVFDFPGAMLRWLAGQDRGKGFAPSGEVFPTIVAGLDLVSANDDEAREAVSDDDSFFRGRVEAGLKTRVYSTNEANYFLSAGWRFYQEIDAPSAVRSADLDQFSHFQARLDLPKGWALTYAAGRLPLDGEDDSTFALGFNVQF